MTQHRTREEQIRGLTSDLQVIGERSWEMRDSCAARHIDEAEARAASELRAENERLREELAKAEAYGRVCELARISATSTAYRACGGLNAKVEALQATSSAEIARLREDNATLLAMCDGASFSGPMALRCADIRTDRQRLDWIEANARAHGGFELVPHYEFTAAGSPCGTMMLRIDCETAD